MKIFGQLEKAQLENTTSDTGSLPKGMITYRTDTNIAKVSNGTNMIALVDESSTQTISGKTYANPVFTGPFTMGQTTTPANPSAGNNKFYFKSDGKLYTLDSSGNEALVGSGSGGVVNLVTNGSADDTAASIFVPYADAAGTRPVDGTGGSPTVTTSMTSTNPLIGTKSFLLTKPASNTQGQGWAVPFTVDLAYRAKSLKISADYIVNSGTFVPGSNGVSPTDGDLIWYIYDVTNSQLIEPSNIKMFSNNTSNSDKFEATFQTSATGSSYRLIAHCASTSALAYELKLDNITVGPQVSLYGTPVTDWVSFTPTGSWSTNTTYAGRRRRVGDNEEIQIRVALTGAPNATNLTLNLPVTIDVNKLAGTNTFQPLGRVSILTQTQSGAYIGDIRYLTTTSVTVAATTTASAPVSNTNPGTFGNGDSVTCYIIVPVVGYSSSVQMSDTADTRVVSFVGAPTSQSLTAAVTDMAFTASRDSHGAWNGTQYRVPTAGDYQVGLHTVFNTGQSTNLSVYVNGTLTKRCATSYAGVIALGYATLENLKAGDLISIRSPDNSCTIVGGSTSFLSIAKIQGPSQIGATETISAIYNTASGQSLANNTNVVILYDTKVEDTHGAYNPATGEFTAPAAGLYAVGASAYVDSVSVSSSSFANLIVNKNGTQYNIYEKTFEASVTVGVPLYIGPTKVRLNAGEKITITARHQHGSSRSLIMTRMYNYLSITRIGL